MTHVANRTVELTSKVSGLIQTLQTLQMEITAVLHELESHRSSELPQDAETLSKLMEASDPYDSLEDGISLSKGTESREGYEPIQGLMRAPPASDLFEDDLTSDSIAGVTDSCIAKNEQSVEQPEQIHPHGDAPEMSSSHKPLRLISSIDFDAATCTDLTSSRSSGVTDECVDGVCEENPTDDEITNVSVEEIESCDQHGFDNASINILAARHIGNAKQLVMGTENSFAIKSPDTTHMPSRELVVTHNDVAHEGRHLLRFGLGAFVAASLAATMIVSVKLPNINAGSHKAVFADPLDYFQPTTWLGGSDSEQ